MFWTLAALSSIAVVVLVWGEWKTSAVRFVAKPIASLGFLAAALERGAFDSTYGKTLLLGLVLAALGDVFLLGSSRPTFSASCSDISCMWLPSLVWASTRWGRARQPSPPESSQ
jgi:uncharacterized membrane protein YhhN